MNLRLISNFGIIHQTTVPHTPKQNSLAKQIKQTIVKQASTMLIDTNLSLGFWLEAVLMATYLI
jgi:hypothetical protein